MFLRYVSVIMRFIVMSLSDSRLMPGTSGGFPGAVEIEPAAFVESLFMLCESHSLVPCDLSTGVPASLCPPPPPNPLGMPAFGICMESCVGGAVVGKPDELDLKEEKSV